MTNKKKKELDDLELPTFEVEERISKELSQEERDKLNKFYYESLIIPANLLRAPLKDASIFFNILIELLDADYHCDNEFESFKENEFYHGGMISRAFKNIFCASCFSSQNISDK